MICCGSGSTLKKILFRFRITTIFISFPKTKKFFLCRKPLISQKVGLIFIFWLFYYILCLIRIQIWIRNPTHCTSVSAKAKGYGSSGFGSSTLYKAWSCFSFPGWSHHCRRINPLPLPLACPLGGQETLNKPKNCTYSLLPFPLDSKKGKRVVRSETLLIGMGKRLTQPPLVWFQNCNASREGSAAPAAHWRKEEAQGEIFVISSVFLFLYGQCSGSVTFWYGSVSLPLSNGSGSGSCSFRQWPSRCQQKMFIIFVSYFLKVHWHPSWRWKVIKKSKNGRNLEFAYYFYLMMGWSGSVPVPLTNGSGRPKNLRNRNTVWGSWYSWESIFSFVW